MSSNLLECLFSDLGVIQANPLTTMCSSYNQLHISSNSEKTLPVVLKYIAKTRLLGLNLFVYIYTGAFRLLDNEFILYTTIVRVNTLQTNGIIWS